MNARQPDQTIKDRLLARIGSREAVVGIIGLGSPLEATVRLADNSLKPPRQY